MGVVQTQRPEHQENRDGDGDRRHHARRENEEQQIVLQRNLEAREGVGGGRAEHNAEHGRAEADDHRIGKPLGKARRTGDDEAILANQPVIPGLRLADRLQLLLGKPGARREDVDIAFHRRRKEGLGRIGDRVGGRLEARRDDPDKRQDRDQRVANDQDPGEPLLPLRRLGNGIAHRCLTLFRALT
ncbi:hypothetical protein D9M72_471050 [compost metagenome]